MSFYNSNIISQISNYNKGELQGILILIKMNLKNKNIKMYGMCLDSALASRRSFTMRPNVWYEFITSLQSNPARVRTRLGFSQSL